MNDFKDIFEFIAFYAFGIWVGYGMQIGPYYFSLAVLIYSSIFAIYLAKSRLKFEKKLNETKSNWSVKMEQEELKLFVKNFLGGDIGVHVHDFEIKNKSLRAIEVIKQLNETYHEHERDGLLKSGMSLKNRNETTH